MNIGINIILDDAPDHESGRFVEVEDDDGRSISIGEWTERDDGYWGLRIEMDSERLRSENLAANKRIEELEAEIEAYKEFGRSKDRHRIAELEAQLKGYKADNARLLTATLKVAAQLKQALEKDDE